MLEVRCDRVRLPNGAESIREYVVHPGAVVIIPVLDNGALLFERQFRYPLRRAFLELPAGKIDTGEDILLAGQRELLEETGYEASSWDYLGVMHPCIGYSDERIEIFLARGLRQVAGQSLDHNEFLDLLELAPEAAREAVFRGEITDAKTITALYWAEALFSRKWSPCGSEGAGNSAILRAAAVKSPASPAPAEKRSPSPGPRRSSGW
ncbi:MAG: NUDIX hydrolase [Azonexus sp.]|nr:NUDIX hydrolase [Azonexus sp.]MBP6906508.1 NUDIX hydrolase [Azonexus sp.]